MLLVLVIRVPGRSSGNKQCSIGCKTSINGGSASRAAGYADMEL